MKTLLTLCTLVVALAAAGTAGAVNKASNGFTVLPPGVPNGATSPDMTYGGGESGYPREGSSCHPAGSTGTCRDKWQGLHPCECIYDPVVGFPIWVVLTCVSK